MPLLSIIILTYNSSDDIAACITSIFKYYKKELESGEFELTVSDNNSTDETVEEILNIQDKVSRIKLIENKENMGFSKGQNKGASHAKGKYLLFLNPDARVLDKNIGNMIEYLEKHKNVGILGGKVLQENGNKELSAGKFYNPWNVLLMSLGLEEALGVRFSSDNTQTVDFVSGGFMLIRSELFQKLKGFDEGYFMYVEDMDICFRAKKLGYSTVFYSEAQVVHKGQGSSSRTFAISEIYKGLLYFYKKNRTSQEFKIVKLLLILKARVAIIIGRLLFGKKYLVKTYLQALQAIQ